MATVALLGTLDTKGDEYAWLRSELLNEGVSVLLIDVGVNDSTVEGVDVTNEEVAAAVGASIEELRTSNDRGAAVATMGRGAAAVLRRLNSEGRIDAAMSVGGSGGSSIAGVAFRELPVGIGKVLV
ncbi:UPF0261 family protein, partial [Salmonella enterica subsp. enterica serovar Saintpaul]|nr:UPF0261 family protein [Salmonella enterica subsp. enterica serovar Saintpaul]